MNALRLSRAAFSICAAAAMLTGCGGGQSAGTLGMQSLTPPASQSEHQRPWMNPGAKSGKLLYVSGGNFNDVFVYTYTRPKLLGTLTGFQYPASPCTDRNGNVWIPNFKGTTIVEYAHGGTSVISTLSVPNMSPGDCSVDPTTGNLAVVGYGDNSTSGSISTSGGIAIYVGAKGSPRIVRVGFPGTSSCTYDDKGNLFVDGQGFSEKPPFVFGEVRKGEWKFKPIRLHPVPFQPGAVRWDGKYVAVAVANSIYRFAVRDRKATKVGSLYLDDIYWIAGLWIQGAKAIVTDRFGSGYYPQALFYAYPTGGDPTRTIPGTDYEAGVTVSVAPGGL
jgi:hypothetical protein